jgi:hypothetical protein
MSSFTNYLTNKVVNCIFGRGVFTPVNLYLGLSTSQPGQAGNNFIEPSGCGYHRLATTPQDWSDAEDGFVRNVSRLCMPLAVGSWGTVTHFGLFDAPQSGRLYIFGQLDVPVTVGPGDMVSFATEQICISID